MKKEIFTLIALIMLYLVATFLLNNSVLWFQISIHLILASIVAFLIFKKDSKHIKKGLIFSLVILVVMNVLNYLIGLGNTSTLSGARNLLNLISLIENPITYAIIFLISFNVPFIIKHFISKNQGR